MVHKQFLRHMIGYESQPLSTHFGQLVKAGIALPVPGSLDDAAVHSKLREVIHALTRMSAYLLHTDHISDRQLYERPWKDMLREDTVIMPPRSGWTCHFDMVSSGSDEDNDNCLRHYSSEEQREWWAKEFLDMVIPPREKSPFDRDRLLSKAKEHIPEWTNEEEE